MNKKLFHLSGYEIKKIQELYPKLQIIFKRYIEISGTIDFTKQMEGFLPITDSYSVKIFISRDFPNEVPIVIETNNKTKGFHTNYDKTLCLGYTEELKIRLYHNPSVIFFINDILVPFLYKCSYVKKYEIVPGGELPHYTEGVKVYFKETLGEENVDLIYKFFKLSKNNFIKGHRFCPCGSGKKIRNCHKELMIKFNEKFKKSS